MYINFLSYWVDFDEKRFSFRCGRGHEVLIEDAVFSATTLDGEPLNLADYPKSSSDIQGTLESATLHYGIQGGPVATPSLGFGFEINAHSVRVFCQGRAFVSIDGFFRWGEHPEESTFSIRTDTQSPALKSAAGPATSDGDNALFDRTTDAILTWNTSGYIRTSFDWTRRLYAFHYTCGIDFGRHVTFQIQEHYCAEKFHIPYKPIVKKTGFETPSVGWMTWYAVQFDASEEVVLDNARKFLEKFRAYCPAPVLWVDWEWCHRCFDGHGEEGLDIFHPRPVPYPNGLAPVAEQLKQLGFLPALWIGATNEGQQNDLLKQHPEWVLAQKVIWCGQWWVDPSHPGVIQEYIPAVFRQLCDWGYRALKWDCLPATLQVCNEFHDKFHDKTVTPHEGLRRMVQAARDTVGEDFFMLSCSGNSDAVITCAMDIFDGARVGGDIFGWKEFLEQGVNRVMHAFPWHNTVFYADADNLVLRKELNTLNQARTRVSFYGLAGLPVTLGDKIDDLDDERTELLRRVMPVVDIHPAELEPKKHG
ncbi:MAG: alpha-galactosidase, partial [Victivallales bacterium]|nr:alpha-galactosidase [Victivallales bacterium]